LKSHIEYSLCFLNATVRALPAKGVTDRGKYANDEPNYRGSKKANQNEFVERPWAANFVVVNGPYMAGHLFLLLLFFSH
jgi:hypothetical protein